MAGLLNKHFVPNKEFKQYWIQLNSDKLLYVRYSVGIKSNIDSLKYCSILNSLTIVRLNFINISNPMFNAKNKISRVGIVGSTFF